MARFVAVTSQIINRIFSANAVFPSAAFAGLPAAGVAGRVYRVTDAGTTGSIWMDTGTRWKPLNGQTLLASLDTPSSNITNAAESIVFQYLLPATMLQTGDRLNCRLTMTKSGTTDTGTLRFRMGTAGTTSDTQLYTGTALTAANRTIALDLDFRLETATTLLQLGINASTGANIGYSSSASNAFAAAVTISNVSNALYFSVGIVAGGATDTVALQDAQLRLVHPA